MARIILQDGRWFDSEKCTHWSEGRRWDGEKWVSRATGSQWDHEGLYHTMMGHWILHTFSRFEGKGEVYKEISEEEAIAWLITNGHDLPE